MVSTGPSVRHRFVARAKFLSTHRPFLQELSDARVRWNAEQPDYQVTGQGLPDATLPTNASGQRLGEFMPPRLRQLFDSWYALEREGRAPDDASHHPALLPGSGAWNTLILRLCNKWWTPDHYSNWLHAGDPAAPFVSAAIIWDPRLVDSNLVVDADPSPQGYAYDPRNPSSDPFNQASNEAWRVLLQTVEMLFQEYETLKSSDFRWAVAQAQMAALQLLDGPIERGEMFRPRFWQVPLFAGMSGKDWDKLRVEATRIAR